mmetsp:Transcript_54734/g.159639  ORF Transcript_54734/g.159639 Transcript_54734/m.159639 type:complete len:255 (-) Transcript_54734:130-894(-)
MPSEHRLLDLPADRGEEGLHAAVRPDDVGLPVHRGLHAWQVQQGPVAPRHLAFRVREQRVLGAVGLRLPLQEVGRVSGNPDHRGPQLGEGSLRAREELDLVHVPVEEAAAGTEEEDDLPVSSSEVRERHLFAVHVRQAELGRLLTRLHHAIGPEDDTAALAHSFLDPLVHLLRDPEVGLLQERALRPAHKGNLITDAYASSGRRAARGHVQDTGVVLRHGGHAPCAASQDEVLARGPRVLDRKVRAGRPGSACR